MRGLILVGVAAVVGLASVEPIGGALAPSVAGGPIPTRLVDLAGYITLRQGDTAQFERVGSVGPLVPTTDRELASLRELSALSFAGGVAVAALTFAVLKKVLG